MIYGMGLMVVGFVLGVGFTCAVLLFYAQAEGCPVAKDIIFGRKK